MSRKNRENRDPEPVVETSSKPVESPEVNSEVAPKRTKHQILLDLATNKITVDEAEALLNPTKSNKPLALKLTEDGDVALVNLRKGPPMTMPPDLWQKFLEFVPQIQKFLVDVAAGKVQPEVKPAKEEKKEEAAA